MVLIRAPNSWFFKLFLGVIGCGLSLLWIIHICIFILPGRGNHVDQFLNTLFIELEDLGGGGFPLFGILFYAIFVFYLMWCVIKGNFKLGMRFLFFKVYPMEAGKTYMSAFLANCWVILLCVFPLIQFTTYAFPVYSRETTVNILFGTQIRYLRFFRYFFENNVFIFAMIGMIGLTIPVVFLCPKNGKKELEKLIEQKAGERQKKEIMSVRR